MSNDRDSLITDTILGFFNKREQHGCGYCKNSSGSISDGTWVERLTVEDYKDLIDRGWRRSGVYCYKPTMDKTCCPQYTIKCDAINFTLNKSHKKIIKKFNKFLNDGIYDRNTYTESQDGENFSDFIVIDKPSNIKISQLIDDNSAEQRNDERASESDGSSGEPLCNISKTPNQIPFESVKGRTEQSMEHSEHKTIRAGCGADPNKPPCKKAKLLRLERKKEKLLLKNKEFQAANVENKQKTLKEFLNDIPSNRRHSLKLTLISTNFSDADHNDDQERLANVEYELYKKYQVVVHNDPPEKLSKRNFIRFLLSTPLKITPFVDGIDSPAYGSYHQQYWLDDKLIAVGVIDVLPECISSVYFFYDPDYRSLSLGTYGSLREIQLVRDFSRLNPDIKNYYMGFYIHSCPKMRYKGNLKPSYLLCPETYTWHPIEKCLPKLDVCKYFRLNEDMDAVDSNACSNDDVDSIRFVYRYKMNRVRMLDALNLNQLEAFQRIGKLVGKKLAHKIIFWYS